MASLCTLQVNLPHSTNPHSHPPTHPPAIPPCACVRHFTRRYGLVRIRENAESIAFYGGEDNEARLLARRLRAAVDNYGQLLLASRNLNFFTSFYRWVRV